MELNYPVKSMPLCHMRIWLAAPEVCPGETHPHSRAGWRGQGTRQGHSGHGKCSLGSNFPSGSLGLSLCCSMSTPDLYEHRPNGISPLQEDIIKAMCYMDTQHPGPKGIQKCPCQQEKLAPRWSWTPQTQFSDKLI